ncbi:hypothetical protein C4D60_Mb04t32520 [Musa balbisiana]|uniref:Uncharacterized protein n=1 Tax=Musa balbisiana TaxID=52838 RepID=A0A4S8KGA1_MUSBA|nr:hypothetical protein C4D60_Mb04t32520 [Musa balbisiana]
METDERACVSAQPQRREATGVGLRLRWAPHGFLFPTQCFCFRRARLISLKDVPAIVRSVKAPCTRRKRTRPIISFTSRGIAYATGVVIRSCVDYTKR